MSTHAAPPDRRAQIVGAVPVLRTGADNAALTDKLLAPIFERNRVWWLLFLPALGGAGLLVLGGTLTVLVGIGEWGNNIPVAWAFGIINFVWWIGIGHAGTFISAFLLLLEQKWRASI
ncbi:MAG TPA: hypothetical protein VM759_12365, partial [Longimicrobium sp.]|nr:hypothetical protein [Longimicrobium sp.]